MIVKNTDIELELEYGEKSIEKDDGDETQVFLFNYKFSG
jgi:hypothetical protein